MKIIAILIFCASFAGATDYQFTFTHTDDLSALQANMKAAGITADSISCIGTACTAINASADPSPVIAAYVYTDPQIAKISSANTISQLVSLLRQGKATQADKDNLLGLLVLVLLGK